MNTSNSPEASKTSGPSRAEAEGIDIRIPTTVICAGCGYNLRAGPFVSRCPECGQDYNARGLLGTNVYRPGDKTFPTQEVVNLIWLLPVSAFVWWFSISLLQITLSQAQFGPAIPIAGLMILAAVVTGVMTVYYGIQFIRKLVPYQVQRRWERRNASAIRADRRALEERRARAGADGKAPDADRSLTHLCRETEEELEEMGYGLRVTSAVFCATCGYQLRGLRFVGACPECGTAYNARPLRTENVVLPGGKSLPWGEIWGGVISAIVAAVMLQLFAKQGYVRLLLLALFFAGSSVAFAIIAWRKSRQYAMIQRVMREAEWYEDDD